MERGPYPGDYTGPRHDAPDDPDGAHLAYAPDLDGDPDAGEIVWAWVPYEEDHTRGKDRPVLVIGTQGPWLLALMLTSKDHDGHPGADGGGLHRDEFGRVWMDLGAGPWDPRGRPSEVRLDRVLRLDPSAVRREGAVLDRARFERVLAGW